MIKLVLAVALGGACGALLRYGLSSGLHHWLGRGFPIGTLAVNVLGSAAIGYLWLSVARDLAPNSGLRAGLLIGLLGAFTTFSAFSLETLELLQSGHPLKAGVNILLNVGFCIGACALGMSLARS